METTNNHISPDWCNMCGGDGFVYDDEALNDGTENFDKVTCWECSGFGIKNEQ